MEGTLRPCSAEGPRRQLTWEEVELGVKTLDPELGNRLMKMFDEIDLNSATGFYGKKAPPRRSNTTDTSTSSSAPIAPNTTDTT